MNETPRKPEACPMVFGMRCGIALALFETGLAFPVRFGIINEPARQILFFLLPIGAYALIGWMLGWITGIVPAMVGLSRKLGLFVVSAATLGVAAWDAYENRSALSDFQTWKTLGPALLFGLLLVLPRFWARARPETIVYRLSQLAIVLAIAATAWWVANPRDPARGVEPDITAPADRPNVVMITWDTVRAGVLPLYGGTGLETPNLDALAARSFVFEDMTAVAPITGPSHASLLTGVAPPSHGLRSNGSTAIVREVPSAATLFQEAGYDTAAFVAAYPVKGRFGFRRGFRVYDDRLHGDRVEALLQMGPKEVRLYRALAIWFKRNTTAAIEGSIVLPRAVEYIENAQGPYFLWVHFFDAHGPFDPEGEPLAKAKAMNEGAQPIAPDPKYAPYLMGHRGEIMELDEMLADLIAALEQQDPGLKKTCVWLTSDHGHCFGDGGYANTHIPSLYEATQHIPGILHLPGGVGGGTRIPESINQVDVAPTFCDLAGVDPSEKFQGSSLMPRLRGEEERFACEFFEDGYYMEAYQDRLRIMTPEGGIDDDRKMGIRSQHWKYWQWSQSDDQPLRYRLFDLRQGEGEDRSEAEPEQLKRMQEAFNRLTDEEQGKMESVDGGIDQTPQDRDALEQLGYIDGDEDV